MLKQIKSKYLKQVIKSARRAQRLVLWIPILSLLVGSSLTIAAHIFLERREIEAQRAQAYQRAKEIVTQMDLELANSFLRVQTYEDILGARPNGYHLNQPYVAQSLEYTIFHRLSIFRDTNPKNQKSKVSEFRLITRINRPNSKLPPINSRYVQSSAIVQAVEELRRSSSYLRTVLHERDDIPRLSVVMRSKSHKDIIFIFTLPLLSLFENVDLGFAQSIVIRDPAGRNAWVLSETNKIKQIQSLGVLPLDSHDPHFFTIPFEDELSQSGVNFNLQFNYPQEGIRLFSIINTVTLLCALITLIISYLFYVLITLNQTAQKMIVSKTVDLENTAHDLKEALAGKTRFLGKISHEIRTPLNLILGMIDLCDENDKAKKLTPYLRSMKSAGEHLLSMIDDLLDLAKAESNDLSFHGRKTNLVRFLSDVAKMIAQDCETKRLKFYTYFDPNLPSVVVCDPNRMRQVLLNLLRNAFKYTESGHISFETTLVSNSEDGHAHIRFQIKDTGIGIPDDKLNKVFDAFFQVENTSTYTNGGVGLGLSIVKDIVQKMNGQIEVQSTLHSGTTFQVDMSMEVSDPTPWMQSYKIDGVPTKSLILLTKDSLLRKSFEPLQNCDFLKVEIPDLNEIEEVVSRSTQSQESIFVVDSEYTGTDLEKLAKTRNSKFLFLLGKGDAGLVNLLPSAIAVLGKTPFLLIDFLPHLGLSPRTKQRNSPRAFNYYDEVRPAMPDLQQKLSVIVADDDLGNIELYKAYFSKTTWNVRYAINGLEAWDFYKSSGPDLMILDVRMPVLDGFGLIERVRADEKAKKQTAKPIIVVTADLLDYTLEKSKQYSCVWLLTKPLKKSLLFEQIAKVINIENTPSIDGSR